MEAPSRSRVWLTHTVHVVGDLVREWRDDRVSGLAAEVAFFGLLSLFPALLTTAAALGWLEAVAGGDVATRAEEEVVDFLRRVLTDEAAGTIDAVQTLFEETDPGVVTIGLVVSLWAASRGFVAVVKALDVVYDLDERRSYVGLRAVALALALGTVVVIAGMLAVLVLGPLFGSGRDVADELGFGGGFATFWDWVRWPLAMLVMVAWAATILHVAPNHHTPWRWDLPGAVLAGAAWAALSTSLRVYLAVATEGANQVLGTLGGSLIVLLWLYLLAVGLLLGGELNAVLIARFGPDEIRASATKTEDHTDSP
jgi:membrane protein